MEPPFLRLGLPQFKTDEWLGVLAATRRVATCISSINILVQVPKTSLPLPGPLNIHTPVHRELLKPVHRRVLLSKECTIQEVAFDICLWLGILFRSGLQPKLDQTC